MALVLAIVLIRLTPARFWLRFLQTSAEPGDETEIPTHSGGELAPDRPIVEQDNAGAMPVVAPYGEGGGADKGASSPNTTRKVGRIVGKVAHHLPFRVRCLPQAMAGQWMLRRRGVRSTLVFGVRRGQTKDNHLEFHAWLIAGGECVLGGAEVGSYTAFPPFAAAGFDR